MANKLKVGFARVNVTPPMGIEIAGYYQTRIADGVLDELEANAIAYDVDGKKVVMVAVDHCGMMQNLLDTYRERVAKKTGIDANAVIIHATHTHTGPRTRIDTTDEIEKKYVDFLGERIADVCLMAINDLKPAKMGYGEGVAPNISFVRRFRMTDGTVETNPGVDNPRIDKPIGDVDERVHVLRFDREGAKSIVLVNFADHPDVIGGNKISADWPGFTRRIVEKTLDNVNCIFFNGAQGDVNHVNVHPKGGFYNDMFWDFDDVMRGYAHSQYMGRVVTGGVLQAYDKVKYIDVDSIKYVQKIVKIPTNKAETKEELVNARKIEDMHLAGKDSELPYKGMMLTTVVAEAERMLLLENAPDCYDLRFSALILGNIAFLGIPGEPFTGIGRGIKATEGFDMIMPMCLTNGSEGYYPMQDAYDEGGYETRSSRFKAGVAELMIKEGQKILTDLNK